MKLEKMLVIVAMLLAAASLSIRFSPSLFVNQHIFVNISSNGNDINCTSCHPQIADELAKSQIHRNFTCEECHRIKITAYGVAIDYAEHTQSGITIGKKAHAAYVPRCLDCHGNNGVYVDYQGVTKTAPIAKAFNTTPIPDYVAHKSFVEWANKSNICVGENEACLACHTEMNLTLTFRYPEYINWSLQFSTTPGWANPVTYTPLRYSLGPMIMYNVTLKRSGEKWDIFLFCRGFCRISISQRPLYQRSWFQNFLLLCFWFNLSIIIYCLLLKRSIFIIIYNLRFVSLKPNWERLKRF